MDLIHNISGYGTAMTSGITAIIGITTITTTTITPLGL